MNLTDVRDASFAAEVLESDLPVLVDFWAAWCAPCRVMHPILSDLAAERDDLRIVRVDVETEHQVAADYAILAMPTFMLFRGGEPVLRLVGARPRRRLERELDEVLGPQRGREAVTQEAPGG
jgi:thioredoxin 1